MRASERVVRVPVYASEVRPEIATEHEAFANVIAWADEHPQAYRIVTASKSKAFGLGACTYMGCVQRGNGADSVLERLAHLKRSLEGSGHGRSDEDFWSWRARFTLDHFGERGFTGGFFQEHNVWTDGKEYPRHCTYLDYTPTTLEEVLDRFVLWADSSNRYEGRTRVTVDGKDKRRFGT